jgi:hypothetical protein
MASLYYIVATFAPWWLHLFCLVCTRVVKELFSTQHQVASISFIHEVLDQSLPV